MSSFVDSLLQPSNLSHKNRSHNYLIDTTDFIKFIENTQISNDVVLVTLDVSSNLKTNIPQTEGIDA